MRLKTGPEQKYLVKQIAIAVDGSFGYTLACGTSSYFAMEQARLSNKWLTTMEKLLAEIDGLLARFLPQNKSAEGGPGSGRHSDGASAIREWTSGQHRSLARSAKFAKTLDAQKTITKPLFRGVDKVRNHKVGDVIKTAKPTSYSTSQKVAHGFLGASREGTIYHVTEHDGAKSISSSGLRSNEHEAVVGKGRSFKVTSVSVKPVSDKFGGYKQVHVTMKEVR